MKTIKASSIFLFIVVLALISILPTLAADAPLSEVYFYNHVAVGGLTALNTTTHRSKTEAEIDGSRI